MEKLAFDTSALLSQTVTLLPEIIVTVVGVIVMLVDANSRGRRRSAAAWTAFAGLVLAALATGAIAYLRVTERFGVEIPADSFGGMLVNDPLRLVFTMIAILVSALSLLTSIHWLDEDELPAGEYYTLLLFATVGMTLMAGAGDLVMIFLGLEIVSIATYAMAGFRRRDLRSNEAGLKYYILGSFSTAFLLYGMALTYGATRTTNIAQLQVAIKGGVEWPGLLLAGAGLMLVGLCFKIAAAPFHVWTPDVYEGAPSVVTGWMSTGPKAAAFAAFLRIFIFGFALASAFGDLQGAATGAIAAIAAFTMIIGNAVAIVQDNIKRMLAYSSVAHAGYALVGLLAGDWGAVAFYMLAYAFMNVGAFAVVATIARRADRATTVEDYRGIGFDNMELSVALSVFMLSLAGFPATAGFMGKLLVFKAAWVAGYEYLVVLGVLASVVSVYYYLRPIVVMFFSAPGEEGSRRGLIVPAATSAALTFAMIGVFYLGLVPQRVLELLYGVANGR
jgi:NADH-quinone oxidoreductase subunit N